MNNLLKPTDITKGEKFSSILEDFKEQMKDGPLLFVWPPMKNLLGSRNTVRHVIRFRIATVEDRLSALGEILAECLELSFFDDGMPKHYSVSIRALALEGDWNPSQTFGKFCEAVTEPKTQVFHMQGMPDRRHIGFTTDFLMPLIPKIRPEFPKPE